MAGSSLTIWGSKIQVQANWTAEQIQKCRDEGCIASTALLLVTDRWEKHRDQILVFISDMAAGELQ